MPIPLIDWDNHSIQEIPEYHRTPRFIAWFQGIIRGSVAWLSKNFYAYCYGDTVSTFWLSGTTYQLNETVVTFFGVYISLKDGNVGNNPDSTTGFWYKISTSHIGSFERVQYNSQKIIIEWALNGFFRTVFRNPTTIISGGYLPLSDIYVETVVIQDTSFVSYPDENRSSASFVTDSGNDWIFDVPIYNSYTSYQYTVNIPTSISIALGLQYESIIRSKVDLVNPAGISYSVNVY